MPDFHIRSWMEVTDYDSNDYIVTADTLETAARKLDRYQNKAQEDQERIVDIPEVVGVKI